ncbi:hypothetical protein LJC57_06770 [Parabacteroides sp. OttesenSCG-928-G07]|nr:hypothetical protein [Parabacteroides sp. OttesenSCG-928-G07]
MFFRNRYLLLCLFGVFQLQATAQIDFDSLVENTNNRPSEIIYLQPSKGIYETGEDLWFKAYLLDAQTFELSNRSQTLYLQMSDKNDSLVWQEKYPIENGIVSGHVYVDENIPEGDCFLQAYTRHSVYKDTTEQINSRKIKVLKNITRDISQQAEITESFRFETFPEGGNLVDGISTRLAFKATNGNGLPIDIEGELWEDEKLLTSFKSIHDGMGAIMFTPHLTKSYSVRLNNGEHYSIPEISPQGMVLRLERQNTDYLEFMISQSSGLSEDSIYLVGQIRGMVCCLAKGLLKNNLRIRLPLKEFHSQGIAEFTLFNSRMQPVAERLVYVHPTKKLYISAESEKRSYVNRENATIKIKVTDEAGEPVRANLGISVYDQAYSNQADPVNILTHSYLSSQIRGKIHNPAYYFDTGNRNRQQALDLLLLTQGWRKYVWSINSPVYVGEMLLTDDIKGVLTIDKKHKQYQNAALYFSVTGISDENPFFMETDTLGQFTIGTDVMWALRGEYLYVKSMLPEEVESEYLFDDSFESINAIRNQKPDFYPDMDLSLLAKRSILDLPVISQDSTILLDEVTVTGTGRAPFRNKLLGRLDALAQKDFGPWVCEHGWLENYIKGYTHHHNPLYSPYTQAHNVKKLTPVIGRKYAIMLPEYYLCEQTGESEEAWCFRVLDYQYVIYEGPYYSEEELLRMNGYWRTKGYYSAREFYQPDEIDIQMSIPDARNTLLWEPSLITDEKGEATVSFYCSDINTGFIGIIEGVDGTGLLGTAKCDFRVMRNF